MTHHNYAFRAALTAAVLLILAAPLALASPKPLQVQVRLTATVLSHCTISTAKKPPAPKCTPNPTGNGPALKPSPKPGTVDF